MRDEMSKGRAWQKRRSRRKKMKRRRTWRWNERLLKTEWKIKFAPFVKLLRATLFSSITLFGTWSVLHIFYFVFFFLARLLPRGASGACWILKRKQDILSFAGYTHFRSHIAHGRTFNQTVPYLRTRAPRISRTNFRRWVQSRLASLSRARPEPNYHNPLIATRENEREKGYTIVENRWVFRDTIEGG